MKGQLLRKRGLMESDFIYVIPAGIFMLAMLIRRPMFEYRGEIKERRVKSRRADRRMTSFRRRSCDLEDEVEEKREVEDRRDITKEKRRRDRRALERIKRL